MLVQCLVGLCCQYLDPDAVDITVGDKMFDAANGKGRDVDVNVTVQDESGVVTAALASLAWGNQA